MSILLNFKDEETNRDKVRFEINKNTFLIEFFPASNSQQDLLAAATQRDRFNFCISHFLAHIERDLCYEENLNLEAFKPTGYAILLKFSREIDFQIIEDMFSRRFFPVNYFSLFLAEENREEILTTLHEYFGKEDAGKVLIEEQHILEEEKKFQTTISPPTFLNRIKPIRSYLTSYAQVYAEILTQEKELAESKRLEDAKEKFAKLDNEFIEIEDYYKQMRQTLTALKEKIMKEERKTKEIIDSIDEDVITKQVNEMKQVIKELVNVSDAESVQTECQEDSHSKGQTSEQKDTEQLCSEISRVLSDQSYLQVVKTGNEDVSSLCQALSYDLLEKNITEAQEILIYATLTNQLNIRHRMRVLNVPHKEVYDDFIKATNGFFLFNSKPATAIEPVSKPQQTQRLVI